MATATVPYGATQPLAINLYQNTSSEAEYHVLKRAYLGLLPPQQIIEICLTFEVHVPFHVRASVWPADLKAAITAMQRQSQPPLPTHNPKPLDDILSKTPPQQEPPDKPTEITSPAHKQTDTLCSSPSTPTQAVTAAPPIRPPAPITQPPYHHQPYGFPQQPSYPHAPYYSTPPTSYNYPHSSYPLYPPTDYPRSTKTSSIQTMEAQLSAEDLPSYEDIIVEALMECPDPEGSVPKNIFTWMSTHYPLQSNFRPSASQALQKAYKRGRFEKSSNGKYRLNLLWEGGSTTRRHARRPLTREAPTSNISSADKAPKASPFTRAPLQNRRPLPSTSIAAGHTPYPGTEYPYTHPPPTQYPEHPSGYSQSSAGDAIVSNEDTGEGSDAWEAAQNILKAINFGSLIQIDRKEGHGQAGNSNAVNDTVRDGPMHSLPQAAAVGVDVNSMGVVRTATSNISVELGAEDRAVLQAQLALLAAQMAELAGDSQDGLSTAMVGKPATGMAEIGDGDVHAEDEDADMERVDVPAASDALRT